MYAKTYFDLLMRLSRDYFSNEYFYYYAIEIPENKDIELIKHNLQNQYLITNHFETRRRRKRKGLANCNVVILNKTAVIVATEGEHEEVKKRNFNDIRQKPLVIFGYEIFISGKKKGGIDKASVRVARSRYEKIKKGISKISLHNQDRVTSYLKSISPYTFSGIMVQKYNLIKQINQRRKTAGLPLIKWEDVKPYS